jgi:hypothetical protein
MSQSMDIRYRGIGGSASGTAAAVALSVAAGFILRSADYRGDSVAG